MSAQHPEHTSSKLPERTEAAAPSRLRVATWNVERMNAERAVQCVAYAADQRLDLLFLNETKCDAAEFEGWLRLADPKGVFRGVVNPCTKPGRRYHGTGVLIREETCSGASVSAVALPVPDAMEDKEDEGDGTDGADWEPKDVQGHTLEGRILTVRAHGMAFVGTYVPNSGVRGLARLKYRTERWDPHLQAYLAGLKPPVVWLGDLNVVASASEIDIHNPGGGRKRAGFTREEVASFERAQHDCGWTDAWRLTHPDQTGYTWWSTYQGGRMRRENKGWRLDYVMVDEVCRARLASCEVHRDVLGSDHAPIMAEFRLD